jgi:hypothetical protein
MHNDLAESLSLDGTWEFVLGGQSGSIRVPGCWEAQGYARRVDGPARYRRVIEVPATWTGQRVLLQFDAVSYYAEVSVNGLPVGTHTGAWTPFACDVTDAIRPGAENEIVVTVWKPGERFPLRESLAGFLPDVCVMFGGLWQPVRLMAFPGPALSDVTVLSDADFGEVRVTTTAHHATGLDAVVQVRAPDGAKMATWRASGTDGQIAARFAIPDPARWGPDDPRLYTAEIRLEGPGGTVARVQRRFGFRTLSAAGEQVLFNGEPVCLRGALNWGWYPDILCPDPDEATIRDEFRRIRALGFNLMKLCLYVPSPRYFDIADEEGMFLWLELPLWLPEVCPHLEQQAPIEYADIIAAVHHHPSVLLYSLGCELEKNVDPVWLAGLDAIVRGGTSGALVCDNSGSGEAYGAVSDLTDFDDYHFYCDTQSLQPLVDHFHRDWRPPRPLIFGEFCAADDYRDLGPLMEIHGGDLPWWLQEQNPIHPLSKIAHTQQLERMQALDLEIDPPELVRRSRQQSFKVRKAVLEKVRTWSKLGGYVVTGLRDTPLAVSALFDDFGQPKYDPAAFRQFNANSVLLVGRGRSRQWSYDGDRIAPSDPYCLIAGQRAVLDLILAHAGAPLHGGEWSWRVVDGGGHVLAQGGEPVAGRLIGGRPGRLGRMVFDTPPVDVPLSLRLEANLQTGDQVITNDWPLWVFPAVTAWPEGLNLLDPTGALDRLDDLRAAAARVNEPVAGTHLLITTVLTGPVIDFLWCGGRVLLLQTGDAPLPVVSGPFWWHAIHLFTDHPLAHAIPHDGFLDQQFYGLATPWAFDTDRLLSALPDGATVTPIWRRLHPSQYTLAEYLFEGQVGAGRLIASTLRFQGGQGDQPAGLRYQVAARWLLDRLLQALVP